MTYEEEPNIFSETDITPEEYVQDAIKQERLAIAERLRLLREKIWLEIKGSPESQNLMLNCDLSPSTTLSIIKDILWIAIHKTEQHFKDLMPHESYVKRQVERESQAFADWLEVLLEMQMDEYYMIKKIEAKIKELRSNPLPKQSVDGKKRDVIDGIDVFVEGKEK